MGPSHAAKNPLIVTSVLELVGVMPSTPAPGTSSYETAPLPERSANGRCAAARAGAPAAHNAHAWPKTHGFEVRVQPTGGYNPAYQLALTYRPRPRESRTAVVYSVNLNYSKKDMGYG